MNVTPNCPRCGSQHTYFLNELICCPECFHEWNPEEVTAIDEQSNEGKVFDAHGNELKDGDTVIVIKDLPLKGTSKSIKAGTKVKNIRLVEGDHNISCKIEGIGAIGLKSEFVKKG